MFKKYECEKKEKKKNVDISQNSRCRVYPLYRVIYRVARRFAYQALQGEIYDCEESFRDILHEISLLNRETAGG